MAAHPQTDNEFRSYITNNRFDVIATGTLLTKYKWIKWALSVIRETNPHVKIIIGNSIATSIPDMILEDTEADIAVMGEGEKTILELIGKLEKSESLAEVKGIFYKKDGVVYRNPPREPIENLDTLPFINRELFDVEAYLALSKYGANEPFPRPQEEIKALNINTTRGCVFSCTFCFSDFWGTRYRFRSPESIIKEIKELQAKYEINYIQLTDMLTFANKRHAEKFCDKMLEEGVVIDWSSTIHSNFFQKPDPRNDMIAKKMKDTGCVSVGFSIESVDEAIRKSMNKKATLDGFSNTRNTLLKAKIAATVGFVMGYPEETKETINKTIDFCIEQNILPVVNYLTPMPHTPIYEYAVSKGFIKDEKEYISNMNDSKELGINLTKMSDEEFKQNVEEAVRRGQRAVAGEALNFETPTKTFRYLSRDKI